MASKNFNLGLLSDGLYVDPTTLNVGIGNTASGGYKLDVTGTGRFTGALSGTSATFSGNVGIGNTISSWNTSFNALQLGSYGGYISGRTNENSMFLGTNHYFDNATSQWIYTTTGAVSQMYFLGADIIFRNNVSGTAGTATGFSERLRITSGGNVGIGTSSPYELLTINNGTQGNSFGLQINNNVNNKSGIGFAQYGSNATYSYIIADGRSSGYMAFSTNDTERLRITSGGNLLVGTTTYAGANPLLEVKTASAREGIAIQCGTGGYSPLAIRGIGNENYFFVNESGNVLIGTTTATGKFTIGDGAKASNAVPFVIQTSDTNTMQLVFNRNTNLNYKIQAVEQGVSYRDIYFNNLGGAVYAGSARIDNNSDARIKDSITTIDKALSKVLSMNGRRYHMLDEPKSKIRYGFIAQELQGVVDELVIESDRVFTKQDGTKIENLLGLETWGSSWAALLVEAMKEQQAQIEELKALIAAK